MTWMLILTIVVAWILLSGFLLISVCMMSSLANRTELLDQEQVHHRATQDEHGLSQEAPGQQTAEAPTW